MDLQICTLTVKPAGTSTSQLNVAVVNEVNVPSRGSSSRKLDVSVGSMISSSLNDDSHRLTRYVDSALEMIKVSSERRAQAQAAATHRLRDRWTSKSAQILSQPCPLPCHRRQHSRKARLLALDQLLRSPKVQIRRAGRSRISCRERWSRSRCSGSGRCPARDQRRR